MVHHSTVARLVRCSLALVLVALLAAPHVLAQDYIIGPGDVVNVTVWGQSDLSRDYPVDSEGLISFPLLGRIKAAGLTAKQLAERVKVLLEKDYLVNPHVVASVSQYLSKKVKVFGEAGTQGIYYLTGQTTLLDILTKAGGIPKTPGKQVVVYRTERNATGAVTGQSILRLKLDKLQVGDNSANIRLQDDDTIFVPRTRHYFLLGEVKAAGTFPLDKETTIVEALKVAGWFTDKATPSAVKVTRTTPDGRQENIALDLSGAIPKDGVFKLQEGDTVFVPKGNSYFVFGEVKSPGSYQLAKPTDLLEAITLAGGFTDKASPGRTRVIRNTPKGQQVINVDMNEVIKRGRREKAISLQENDVIVVPESFF